MLLCSECFASTDFSRFEKTREHLNNGNIYLKKCQNSEQILLVKDPDGKYPITNKIGYVQPTVVPIIGCFGKYNLTIAPLYSTPQFSILGI